MGRRRTSTLYKRGNGNRHTLRLNVQSPRIFAFQAARVVPNLLTIACWIGLVWLVCWGLVLAKDALIDKNEEFALKEIELYSNGSITKQRIVREAGLTKQSTLFSIDVVAMEAKLLELPEVVSADVTRILPNTLKVDLLERVPVAWLHAPSFGAIARHEEQGVLIGDDGFIFPWVKEWNIDKDAFPVLDLDAAFSKNFELNKKMASEEALLAHSLMTLHSEVDLQDVNLESVKVENFYTLTATYSDTSSVVFGMYDHDRQIKDLIDIRGHARLLGKQIEWLDMRPKKNIPGKYRVTQL